VLTTIVRDTGIGIRKEDAGKLFEKFQRLDLEQNSTVEGTGLGLAITYRLLTMMGGTIRLESEYGKGSVFSFAVEQEVAKWDEVGDISARLNDTSACAYEYHELFHAPDARILVVDDTEMNLAVIKSLLKKTRIMIDTAMSGKDAVSLSEKTPYDLLFVDHMMPDMDGLTFLKKLRAMGNNTPTIMLTAMGGAENAIDGLRGGANDYLDKPFQLQELILRIENMTRFTPEPEPTRVDGILFTDNEFFVADKSGTPRILQLSAEEKKLLRGLTTPIGNIVPASPMVAKRLREKINNVSLDMDIITIRGRGYKLVCPIKNKG
jgi:DNA-binding response OmpR family regulator